MHAVIARIACLILGGALVSGAPLVSAQSLPSVPGAPAAVGGSEPSTGLHLEVNNIVLAPITAEEIAGGSLHAHASGPLTVQAEPSRLVAKGSLGLQQTNPVIRREIRGVWRYGRDTSRGRGVGEPRIRVSTDGPRGGQLVSEDGRTRVPVNIVPLRAKRQSGREGLDIYEGDIVLEIPVEALAQAGRYRLQLRFTVEEI